MGALKQGAGGMEKTAKAGSWGKHPQHIHRSLMALCGQPAGAPEFSWYEIPTAAGPRFHPFMLPHHWFSSLYHKSPERFESTIKGGDDAACLAFWTLMADTPFVQRHPHLAYEHQARAIPIGLYGDAGSFSHQESLYVFTWNSLLGVGQTMAKRYLATCIRKGDVVAGTFDTIFRILAWSCNALLSGITPEVDWKQAPLVDGGRYLADGYRACLTQVRGDWEFYCSIFAFPRWNEAVNLCWLCEASSSGPLRFSNFADNAPWRATRHTHESYVAKRLANGQALPALFEHAVGFRLECVMINLLHCCDQGFALHLIGNIFHECISRGVFCAGGKQANLEALDAALLKWYKREKVESRIKGKLTMERVRSSNGWPKLKCKAAAARHVAPFALELARQHLDRRMIAMCQLLCEFFVLINAQGMFLDNDAKDRLPKLGRALCGLYAKQSTAAFDTGIKTWKMTPKVHIFLHVCEWQGPSVGNPRFYWTYADEDLVGVMIEVAQSCHWTTMAPTAMVKWLVLNFE